MGRSWLQAGLKIEAMLEGSEPLFFESVVAWFEQCYRSNPAYRAEIAELHALNEDKTNGLDVAASIESSPEGDPMLGPATIDKLKVLKEASAAPLLSVVVPIYNHYDYIEKCLDSLTVQGTVAFEIVCVDDGSSDPRVAALMGALQGRLPHLKIIRLPKNQGISIAQNIAVDAASGEYVAFLDCDDELAPGALSVVEEQIQLHPDVDYFFSDRQDIDECGSAVRVARYGGYDSIIFRSHDSIRDDLLDGMVASHLKVVRRSAYLEVGGCDPKLSGVQDWGLALRLAEGRNFRYIKEVLYRHRVHRKSVTRGDLVAQFRKTNILRRHYSERWLAFDNKQKGADFLTIQGANLPIAPEVLKAYWRDGRRCIVDLRGPIFIGSVNFVREFNSYFERVLWDDPAVPAALFGYVWNVSILDISK